MKLTLWTYEGPPHVGAMRVATAMDGLHYVLHAPQGDTYADLLFTMIERQSKRPPVTYTTFQARDLGGDTAELFKNAAREAYERFKPQALLVGASCTAELIQDDPGGLGPGTGTCQCRWWRSNCQRIRKRRTGDPQRLSTSWSGHLPCEREPSAQARCNILGPTALGFRHRDDVTEVVRYWIASASPSMSSHPWGNARGPGTPGRRQLQHRAVSRNRHAGGVLAGAIIWPEDDKDGADRGRRHARFHCGSCSTWPASIRRRCCRRTNRGCRGIRGRSTQLT